MTLDVICLAKYVWRRLQWKWKTLVKVEDEKLQINYYQSN